MTVGDEGADLTDGHMQLLQWLDEHPTRSLADAAQALGLEVREVEILCADLVAEG
jgi:DNA-binding IclR family transcriptional regulator